MTLLQQLKGRIPEAKFTQDEFPLFQLTGRSQLRMGCGQDDNSPGRIWKKTGMTSFTILAFAWLLL
jgi:hypothetical protein